jgi:hypothetical protein
MSEENRAKIRETVREYMANKKRTGGTPTAQQVVHSGDYPLENMRLDEEAKYRRANSSGDLPEGDPRRVELARKRIAYRNALEAEYMEIAEDEIRRSG